jgi:hypothetical protein
MVDEMEKLLKKKGIKLDWNPPIGGKQLIGHTPSGLPIYKEN